ncbi:MAG TPA: hypothetical protein VFI00_12655 [Kribbella sp.]|nr:hypothetical protein [Kribbella sp.]
MTQLAVTDVVTAATHLMRAGQWTAATNLLASAHTDDPAEDRALALARAEVAVDQDFAQQTDHAPAALKAVTQLVDESSDPTVGWDVEMLRFRKDYGTALVQSGELTFGPEGRDEAASAALADRAEQLGGSAPDDARRGAVSFYAGLVADNLLGRTDEAFANFTTALELGETTGDELLASLALRHLGDHAHTAGDLRLAREQWERSTELRQKVGHLLGALAQQTLLAVLLRDEGDIAGSQVLATEVNRWARQVDLPFLVSQTDALLK